MPLSEHEQRVLEQMERALYAEDPRLASTLKKTQQAGRPAVDRTRLVVGVLVALAGLALVVTGVMTQQIWIGGVGFLAMVLGGAWAATPAHRRPHLGVAHPDGSVRHPAATSRTRDARAGRMRRHPSSGSFMQRMEDQWDRRKEQGPF